MDGMNDRTKVHCPQPSAPRRTAVGNPYDRILDIYTIAYLWFAGTVVIALLGLLIYAAYRMWKEDRRG